MGKRLIIAAIAVAAVAATVGGIVARSGDDGRTAARVAAGPLWVIERPTHPRPVVGTPSTQPAVATTPTPKPTHVATRRAVPTPPAASPLITHRAVAAPPPVSYPSTLRAVPSSASQAITVTAGGYGTTSATLEAWSRAGSGWTRVYGPWIAHLGYTGLAHPGAKREGDGHTPSGVFGFQYMFGVHPDPGVHYSYRQVGGAYDVWDDDPTSPLYNEWVDARSANPGRAPEPMDNTPAYDEGAVIAYNTARTPGLGSAIFLHVSTGGSTAGCVSIPEPDLLSVLRWMGPGTDISIGVD